VNKQVKTDCKSVFKDSENISAPLSRLWAEVINQLEQTKYIPHVDDSGEKDYNGQVQSHPNRNQKIEVSGE
jgi:hypothetical protein